MSRVIPLLLAALIAAPAMAFDLPRLDFPVTQGR